MLEKHELPVDMKSKFWRAINWWMRSEDITYKIDENWQIYFCKDSNHYYGVQTDAASTITANTACIRKAYRIDPNTGNFLSEKLTDEGNEEHFIFVVKRFDSPDRIAEAQVEQETLQQHQFAEPLIFVGDEQNPVVISIYYPGLPLTKSDTTHTQDFIKTLTFVERVDLCYQLAKQYYNLHHHKDGAKLHIDVKGQNTMVYQLSDGRWRSRLIDFGSVKRVENAQAFVPSSIAGMTSYAIAPEVISKVKSAMCIMDKETGEISGKTDVYAFSAIVMSLLGATNPYNDRHIPQNAPPGFIDIVALKKIVSAKFKSDDLFQQATLNYHFSGQIQCYFKRIVGPAPNPQQVLETQKTHKTCYLAYDNYLLYKDGERIFGYTRPLRNIDKAVGHLKNDSEISVDEMVQLDHLSGYRREKNGHALQTFLETCISNFITLMHDDNPVQRPCSQEVYWFFKTVFAMCYLSEYEFDFFDGSKTQKSTNEIECHLKLMLLQLELIRDGMFEQNLLEDDNTLVHDPNFYALFDQLKQYFKALKDSKLSSSDAPKPHPWLKPKLVSRGGNSIFNDEEEKNHDTSVCALASSSANI